MTKRELDAFVAEKFMRYQRRVAPPDASGENGGNDILVPPDFDQWLKDGYDYPKKGKLPLELLVPDWSASVQKAWPLIDVMNRRGVEVVLGSLPTNASGNRCYVELRAWRDTKSHLVRERLTVLHGNDLAEMICQAAIQLGMMGTTPLPSEYPL
jgi:hypothetical protein